MEPTVDTNPAASIKQAFQSYRPILAALSSRRHTVTLCAFVRCPQIILVVVRAIAVPVIRDGEVAC
jgi:hypothetical protein